MEKLKEFLLEIQKNAIEFDRDLSGLTAEEQVEIIKYSCGSVPHEEELIERLRIAKKNKKALTIKFGVDPTGADLHLGHAVPLVLLNRLHRMGHKIVFLVGNFTAKIGDPSGMEFKRKILKKDEIVENFKDYRKQVEKVLNFSDLEIVYNADWLNNVKLPQLVSLLNQLNAAHQVKRNDLDKKINEYQSFTYAELLYPVLVGLDSVRIKPDIEVAGEDQMENLLMAREIMAIKGEVPQCNLVTGILPGKDTTDLKMSKGLNNFISLRENPVVMFTDIANIPDENILPYFDLLTELSIQQINDLREIIQSGVINLGILKLILARAVVYRIYGKDTVTKASTEYTQKLIKESELTDIKVRRGSDISFCQTLATITAYSEKEIRALSNTLGLAVHRLDGGFVDFLEDVEQSIEAFPMSTFYLKISNKDIVKVVLK